MIRFVKCIVTLALLVTAAAVQGDPRPDPFAPLGYTPYILAPQPVTHKTPYSDLKTPQLYNPGPLQPMPLGKIEQATPQVPTTTIATSATGDWTLVGLMSSGPQESAMFSSADSTAVVRAGDTLPDNKTIVAEIDGNAVVVKPLYGDSKARVQIGQSFTLTTTGAQPASNGAWSPDPITHL